MKGAADDRQDGVDPVNPDCDAECKQRAARGEVPQHDQDEAFDRDHPPATEQLEQGPHLAQLGDQAQQQGQPPDDIEGKGRVALPAPKFRFVKRLRHRDPPVP